ncbi:MAG: inositol monophosphatase [Bacteroidetes bacterium]|nr:inositol monophosphatase [Bacteroidota bacterium]
MPDLHHLTRSVIALCIETGQFQLQHFNEVEQGKVSDKGLNQLVSFVDVESEKKLIAGLSQLLPGSGFIAEENTAITIEDAEYCWIIDPLDGTTNYLHGLPVFCISVALRHGEQTVLGVVHAPALDETFHAIHGQGADLNGETITVSNVPDLKHSLLATGFPYYEFEKAPEYLRALHELMKRTHGLRRMGSAAIDLAYTACGRFDGFYEMGLAPWDVAAGALIVKEAGGLVGDFQGGGNYLFGRQILATNRHVFSELQEIVLQNGLA